MSITGADTTIVKLSGHSIQPAKVDGVTDIFCSSKFIFCKPRWMSDEEATECFHCRSRFSQLRRKHHCRQCGRVYCNKCCREKVPLPQLGLEEPERVCEMCRPVTECITKSRSQHPAFLVEAARGLSNICRDSEKVGKAVELGAIQTLISLAHIDSEDVMSSVMSGLHSLCTHEPLLALLSSSGAIKTVCSILTKSQPSQVQMSLDGISCLLIFCKSQHLRTKALQDGALVPVLSMCSSTDNVVSLMALSTLSLIIEHPGTHDIVIEAERSALPTILHLTQAQDEQVRETSLKVLCHLSMGSDWHRHRIIQDDFSSGSCLVRSLLSQPNNQQVLSNAVCLAANLATSAEDQNVLHDMLDALISMLSQMNISSDILCHLTRALANFAKYKENSSRLLPGLSHIINKCLGSNNSACRVHATRAVFCLMTHAYDMTFSELMRNGMKNLLESLTTIPGVATSIHKSLLSNLTERARPS